MKFTIRQAEARDRQDVIRIVLARSAWLEDRGMPSWRDSAAKVADLTGAEDGSTFVLEADGRPVGCTTVTDTTPPMAWTPEELAQPALYLYTTVTDPALREWNPGALLALWVVDRAAREGKEWVRRGCRFDGLVAYYQRQGFILLHTMQKTHGPMYLLARRAQYIDDLEERLAGLKPALDP